MSALTSGSTLMRFNSMPGRALASLILLSAFMLAWPELLFFAKSVQVPVWLQWVPLPFPLLVFPTICMLPLLWAPSFVDACIEAIAAVLYLPFFAIAVVAAIKPEFRLMPAEGFVYQYIWVSVFMLAIPAGLLVLMYAIRRMLLSFVRQGSREVPPA